jgi:putative transposase
MNIHKAYPSDLTDAEWQQLEPLIPPAKPGGRPREQDMRKILNALFYLLRSGCQWNMLPHDLPNSKTVYEYYSAWERDGTWQRIHDTVRRRVRISAGRDPEPSAAIMDSQSVRTTEKGGSAAMTPERR